LSGDKFTSEVIYQLDLVPVHLFYVPILPW